MKKETEHLFFSVTLVLLGVGFVWYFEKSSYNSGIPANATQVGGTANYVGDTPTASQPVAASVQSAMPGVDISLGGSPTYLTYNVPQGASLQPLDYQGVAPSAPQINEGGCCDGCENSKPQTFQAFASSPDVMQAALDNYNNLESTGLLQ